MKVAIILNSGKPISRKIDADKVICVDGGLNLCPVRPDFFVGDCDSVTTPRNGILCELHDVHKDFTDGELAIRKAAETGADELVFYGITGGDRYDHTLGNLASMAFARSLGMKSSAKEELFDITALCADKDAKFVADAEIGCTVSIIPHGGDAVITDSEGLEYPLQNLRLTCRDSRGISNTTTAKKFSFTLVSGDVFVFVTTGKPLKD